MAKAKPNTTTTTEIKTNQGFNKNNLDLEAVAQAYISAFNQKAEAGLVKDRIKEHKFIDSVFNKAEIPLNSGQVWIPILKADLPKLLNKYGLKAYGKKALTIGFYLDNGLSLKYLDMEVSKARAKTKAFIDDVENCNVAYMAWLRENNNKPLPQEIIEKKLEKVFRNELLKVHLKAIGFSDETITKAKL
jgi:hypothetical protein